jgi:hypothetical protein
MENIPLVVRSILGQPVTMPNGTVSTRVTLDIEHFQLLSKSEPTLPYTTAYEGNQKLRLFEIDGVKVYSFYDFNNKEPNRKGEIRPKNKFYMDLAEAQKRFVPMTEVRSQAAQVSIGLSSLVSQVIVAPVTATA